MAALVAALTDALPLAVVKRDAGPDDVGEEIGAYGFVNVAEGEPELLGELLGTVAKEWRLAVPIGVLVRDRLADARNAAFASLVKTIGATLEADRTLGGIVDWVEIGAAAENETLTLLGGTDGRAATIEAGLYYITGDNPLEDI